VIELKDIVYRYQTKTEVFNGFNLTLNQGDKLGLIGPNGSGKTTLFKIIMGLLFPDRGVVKIFGQRREKEEDFLSVRERIGFLFQDSDDLLFCPTVEEDLAFGPLNMGKSKAEAKEIAEETLALVGMEEYKQKVSYQLSAGEKRMVAFAAVWAMQPDILLLDEPFSSLDQSRRDTMIKILLETDKSYIIASHREGLISQVTNRKLRIEN